MSPTAATNYASMLAKLSASRTDAFNVLKAIDNAIAGIEGLIAASTVKAPLVPPVKPKKP